jgi:hypothetical protein
MESKGRTPQNNAKAQGYKVTGDGNVPNTAATPGNRSFNGNPHAVTSKSAQDMPEPSSIPAIRRSMTAANSIS